MSIYSVLLGSSLCSLLWRMCTGLIRQAWTCWISSSTGLPTKRILLLITFRPEFTARWQGRPNVSLLSLTRLPRRQTAELARQIAGEAELPDEVVNQILARTDGVPLFVEELTKTLLENGISLQENGGAAGGSAMPLVVPATLHDSLVSRLDRFPAAKIAAQQAAVIGREFTYRMLASITSASEPELQVALQQLVSSELVFVARSAT